MKVKSPRRPPGTMDPTTKAMMRRVGSTSSALSNEESERGVDGYLCGLNSKRGSILAPQERETLGRNMRMIRRMSESGKSSPFQKKGSPEPLVPLEATNSPDEQDETKEPRSSPSTGSDLMDQLSPPSPPKDLEAPLADPFVSSPEKGFSTLMSTDSDACPLSLSPTGELRPCDTPDMDVKPIPLRLANQERTSHSAMSLADKDKKNKKSKTRKRECIVIQHSGNAAFSPRTPTTPSGTLSPPSPMLLSSVKYPQSPRGHSRKQPLSGGSSPLSSGSPSPPSSPGLKGSRVVVAHGASASGDMAKLPASKSLLIGQVKCPGQDMPKSSSFHSKESSYASPRKILFIQPPKGASASGNVDLENLPKLDSPVSPSTQEELKKRFQPRFVEGLFPVPVPRNVVSLIFSSLSPTDLLNASMVSKLWREYTDIPALWATFAQTLGVDVPCGPCSDGDKKDDDSSSLQRHNWSRVAIQSFRNMATKLSPAELVEACYKRMLYQQLQYKKGSGYSGMLSVRGEHLFKQWKSRWAVVWNNCLVMYRSRRPDELPLVLIPLTSDVMTQIVRRSLFTITSKNGVLLSYKLSTSGSVVEVQQGSLFLDAGVKVETLAWINTITDNARLSEQLVGPSASSRAYRPRETKPEVVPQSPQQRKKKGLGSLQQQATSQQQLFGVPLRTLSKKGTVPQFLQDIMDRLEAVALDEEGLFRLNGSISDVMDLRRKLETNSGRVDISHEDPHTLTAVLKMFFRELPEPLIPPDVNQVINEFLGDFDIDAAVARASDPKVKNAIKGIIEAVRYALCQLPPANLSVMLRLTKLLRAVIDHSDKNLMTRDNLFIVLLPTLRCAPNILALIMTYPDELLFPA